MSPLSAKISMAAFVDFEKMIYFYDFSMCGVMKELYKNELMFVARAKTQKRRDRCFVCLFDLYRGG